MNYYEKLGRPGRIDASGSIDDVHAAVRRALARDSASLLGYVALSA